MFYWSKDDVTFTGQGEGLENSVRLKHINESLGKEVRQPDAMVAGTYYCHANNTVGEDTCHLQLTGGGTHLHAMCFTPSHT